MKSLLQDGNQQINADSDPDLGFDGVERCSVKCFDSQMLLDPAEEELSGKGLARFLGKFPARFQPLPIGTAREVFPQAARPVVFVERVMSPCDADGHFHE